MRGLIHDKLITDFAALQFEGGNTLFGNVKKDFRQVAMGSGDCLLLMDDMSQDVQGITTTQRDYGFLWVYMEATEASITDIEAATRISRMANVEDAVVNYLQKIPNNLRAWGDTNSIEVVRIAVTNVFYDESKTPDGYQIVQRGRFFVRVDVNARNL